MRNMLGIVICANNISALYTEICTVHVRMLGALPSIIL